MGAGEAWRMPVKTGMMVMVQMAFALFVVAQFVHDATEEHLVASPSSHGMGARRLGTPDGKKLIFQQLSLNLPMGKDLLQWCRREGCEGAWVANNCHNGLKKGKICLVDHQLSKKGDDIKFIARKQVLSGWVTWDFLKHIKGPYSVVTVVHNPLVRYVQNLQLAYQEETANISFATIIVSQIMDLDTNDPIEIYTKVAGMLWRLVSRASLRAIEVPREKDMELAVAEAKTHLDTYWFIGLRENPLAAVAVMRKLLDPEDRHSNLWDSMEGKAKVGMSKFNFPVRTSDLIDSIEPDVMSKFNDTLRYEWAVYEHGIGVFLRRCREILPATRHKELCVVPLS
ncbi:unnamed protein product [Discosporangium mesarthrocarpum]